MKKRFKYLIAIILIILFTFSIVPRSFQNDTFYVIELGRQIEKTGVDWEDHYSIHSNLEYRYPHWAFDVINAKVFDLFGFEGIYGLTMIFASIFVLIIFGTLIKKDVNFNLAFIGTLIVSYMMKEAFFERGQIVSYSLFLIEYLILENFVERPTILKGVGLFIVSSLMANFHSTAWIMMLVLILPFIGEQLFYTYSLKGINERLLKKYYKKLEKAKKEGLSSEKIKDLEEKIAEREKNKEYYENDKTEHKIIVEKNPNIKYAWIAVVVLILGALVTPLKLTPFTYFLKISLGNTMSYINEHLPVIPANSLEFLTYTIVIVALIGFTNAKFKLSDAFLILGLYLMALVSRRNVYLLIALTACILIQAIDYFIKSHMKEIKNKNNNMKVFAFLCVCSFILTTYMFVSNKDVEHIDKTLYPVEATEYIKENLDYKNIRLYNRYDYGSYLLMEEVPVFIDSRCDLYTPEFNKGITVFDDFMDLTYGKITLSSLMDKYDLEYALVPVKQHEQVYMKENSEYTEIYKDKNFAIYRYDKDK